MIKTNSTEFSGIILAGGASSRMGFCKSEIKMGGEYLIKSNIEKISPLFKELFLVTSKKTAFFESLPINKIINPYHPSCGPITGLLTSISAVKTPFSFIMACDMPFTNTGIIKRLGEITREDDDIIIPRSVDGLEPLFAVYSRRCIPVLKNMVRDGNFRIQKMFSSLNTRYLSEEEIEYFDPRKVAFFNINNKEDLEKAKRISKRIEVSGTPCYELKHGKEVVI